MIVDDHHALVAVLTAEVRRNPGYAPAAYLDARTAATMHLRLVSALHKPTAGRLSRHFDAASSADPELRAALLSAVAEPSPQAVTVLDDRPLAARSAG